jgi:hypothetical protein
MTKRQTFTKAFKAEAVRLLEQSGKPAAELARELGVRRNQLYKWQAQTTAQGERVWKRGQATFQYPYRCHSPLKSSLSPFYRVFIVQYEKRIGEENR